MTSASEDTFDADVIGVDVIGFSRFTQELIDRKGAGAAEEVRDVLDVGFRAVSDRLKDHGFTAVDSLGDGILLARPKSTAGAALAQLAGAAEQAFVSALGDLRVRAAHASGKISLCRVGGLQQSWDVVATGSGIEALHAAMRRKRELEPVRTRSDNLDVAVVARTMTSPDNRAISEIRRLAVAFVALKPPPELLTAPLATLQDIASLGQGLAEACGGHLEKITHDDKGLMLDFAFARTRDVGLTALDSALDFILDIRPLLGKRGFDPRFGLSEGFVYRGALELSQRTIPIVHGPAVNLGAKLAAAGKGDIALDWPSAQSLVARFKDFTAGVEHTLPNGNSYVAFALDNALRRPAAKAKVLELTGRDRERALLSERFEALEQKRGGLVVLSAPPGMGKTKLLDSSRISVGKGTVSHWLHADPRRLSEYMSLWHELTPQLIATMREPGHTPIADALTADGIPADLHAVLSDVAADTGLARFPRADEVEGIARRELLERAIVAVAKASARDTPTLICVDDAHWCDEASLRVLAQVLRQSPQLLLVLAHREGHYAALDDLKRSCGEVETTTLSLGPLPADDIKHIAAAASPMLSGNAGILEQVFNLSGGSPFHAEQLAHLLQDRIAKSVAALARDLAGEPMMIERVLDERLDGLTPVETQLVRTLAIFDRPIASKAADTLIHAPPHVTEDAVARLDSNAFIALSDTRTITMKSRLLADAVIGRIPPREIKRLHLGAARFAARLRATKEDVTVSDADLGHHWREAGETERAAVSFGKAGDGVLYAGAPDLAVGFYKQAILALAPGDQSASARAAGWHAGAAVAHWAQGEMHQALDHASRALDLVDARIGGPRWLPSPLRKLVARTRRIALASTPLRDHAVPHGLRAPLVTLSAIRAEMAFFLGNIGAVLSASASISAYASAPRLRARARARANLFLGYTLAQAGLVKAAHRTWDAARAIGDAAGDSVASSHGYLGEAIWHMSFGRWDKAKELLEAARHLYGDVGDPAYEKFVETLLAFVSYFRGDWQACVERYNALRTVGERQRNLSTQAWGYYGAAAALTIPGRWHEADALLRNAEAIVNEMPDRQSQVICKGVRPQIEFGEHRYQRALDSAMDCLAFARALPPNNFGSLEGFAAPAEIFLRLAREERAPASVRTAAQGNVKAAMKVLARFAKAHPIAQPRLHLCEAIAERLEGRGAEASQTLQQGIDRARALDMKFELQKLEREREASS